MKTVYFAKKETSYSRYSVELPKELGNATEEEIKDYICSGNAAVEYVKHLDTPYAEPDFDYEFDIKEG